MKAIPVAVRERIIHLYGQGRKTQEIATSFGYCVAAVRRVRQNYQQRGTLEPLTHQCGRKSLLTVAVEARLRALLDKKPDATLAELGAKYRRPTSTIDLWLGRLGLSCKKNPARGRAVAARRAGPKKAMAGTSGRSSGRQAGVRG